jgi:Divergent InlB B-repeat domain
VERKTETTGTYARIATTGTGITTYTDSTVVAGTTYCYRVTAVNAAGTSDSSNEACGSPAAGFDVSVTTTGSGSGTVVSTPAGITCPGTCVQTFAAGKVVTLTATPATGSSFSGWSGGSCAGTDSCILVGNTPVTATATFALTAAAVPAPGAVTLAVSGNPATGPYAVEAQTTLPGPLTVNFFVDGGFVQQEVAAKYCLFGGDAACGTGVLGAGAHVIKAQVLAPGTTTVLAETQLTVTEGSFPPVTLVVTGNPATGPYAVEAQTTLPGALTVNFFVDGSYVQQEFITKYCLFGGDATCATGTLGAGTHGIKVQVYPQDGRPVVETQITVTE